MKTIKQLADLIEANPNCEFVIDNDAWWINGPDDNQIATDSEFEDAKSDNWYGPHYGGTLAAAMVELLNRKGFNIKAGAC